jgi:hypothetical protein
MGCAVFIACMLGFGACRQLSGVMRRGDAPQVWKQTEIALASQGACANPYTDVEVYADFRNAAGTPFILVDHGIVPVYRPVFQGYGWKGRQILGRTCVPAEYARYCRYLVARGCCS